MADQLPLLERPAFPQVRRRRASDWRLDERTRAAGKRGIEAARRALRESARPVAA